MKAGTAEGAGGLTPPEQVAGIVRHLCIGCSLTGGFPIEVLCQSTGSQEGSCCLVQLGGGIIHLANGGESWRVSEKVDLL